MFEIQEEPAPQPTPQQNLPIGDTVSTGVSRNCAICSQEFTPSKYRPEQQVCSKPECQKERQRKNILSWRERNPAYFRHIQANPHWRNKRSLRSKQWRQAHPDHIREYRKNHREYYRLYMREYMRQYRKQRAGGEVAVESRAPER